MIGTSCNRRRPRIRPFPWKRRILCESGMLVSACLPYLNSYRSCSKREEESLPLLLIWCKCGLWLVDEEERLPWIFLPWNIELKKSCWHWQSFRMAFFQWWWNQTSLSLPCSHPRFQYPRGEACGIHVWSTRRRSSFGKNRDWDRLDDQTELFQYIHSLWEPEMKTAFIKCCKMIQPTVSPRLGNMTQISVTGAIWSGILFPHSWVINGTSSSSSSVASFRPATIKYSNRRRRSSPDGHELILEGLKIRFYVLSKEVGAAHNIKRNTIRIS